MLTSDQPHYSHKKKGQHSGRLRCIHNATLVTRDSKFAMKTSSEAPNRAAAAASWTFDTRREPLMSYVVWLLTRLSECQDRTLESSDLGTFFIFYCPSATSPCELWPPFPVPHSEDQQHAHDFQIGLASASWPAHCRLIGRWNYFFFFNGLGLPGWSCQEQ